MNLADYIANNDDDLAKAMAASLHEAVPPANNVVYGPQNLGETAPLKPQGLSYEDQALSRALEASLATSVNADIYEEVEGDDLVRKPGA